MEPTVGVGAIVTADARTPLKWLRRTVTLGRRCGTLEPSNQAGHALEDVTEGRLLTPAVG